MTIRLKPQRAKGAASLCRCRLGAPSRSAKVESKLVSGKKELLGFVSGGDVVKHLARQSALVSSGINLFHVAEDAGFLERFDALMKTRALDIASRNVLVVEADSDPEDAFKLLAERRIKKLPVVLTASSSERSPAATSSASWTI